MHLDDPNLTPEKENLIKYSSATIFNGKYKAFYWVRGVWFTIGVLVMAGHETVTIHVHGVDC
jgi:hypothetical protein